MEMIKLVNNASKRIKEPVPYKDFSIQQQKRCEDQIERVAESVWNFFTNDAMKYGYEERIGQQDMALDIVECLRDKEHIAVEAGVGIGKSFGYLIPLSFYHKLIERPIAISTSTIALQEQLADDIKNVTRMTGHDVEVILAKGQTHFLCKRRASEFQQNNKIFELSKSEYKERKDIPYFINNRMWRMISVQYNFKDCNICDYKSDCYYFYLRGRMASTTGFILCNHDLLIAHLKKVNTGQRLLLNGDIAVKVIDEAHNLEDKIRSAYTIHFEEWTISVTAKEIRKGIRVIGTDIVIGTEDLLGNTRMIYQELNHQIKNQMEAKESELRDTDRYFFNMDDRMVKLINKQIKYLERVDEIIQLYYDEDHGTESMRQAVESFDDIYNFFINVVDQYNYLVWLEMNKAKIEIFVCPKDIAEKTSELFFTDDRLTILTSATMTNQKVGTESEKYSYFVRNTGFPNKKHYGYLSSPKPSPFPYDLNAKIYYASNLPNPRIDRDRFIEEGTKVVIDLINLTKGKALILFTAKTDMEIVYQKLKDENLPYEIIMQNEDSSQEDALSTFRMNIDSVLLGTGAYWEGINIEGESLSNLIIFRLPFPVPDPIIEYKCSIEDDPLMAVNVPIMIIKLNQGIGRLIRSNEDKGIVSIIDPRLGDDSPAKYKSIVWDSLPIKNRTESFDEIASFYHSLNEAEHMNLPPIISRTESLDEITSFYHSFNEAEHINLPPIMSRIKAILRLK